VSEVAFRWQRCLAQCHFQQPSLPAGCGANCAFMTLPAHLAASTRPVLTGWLADPSVLAPDSEGIQLGSEVCIWQCVMAAEQQCLMPQGGGWASRRPAGRVRVGCMCLPAPGGSSSIQVKAPILTAPRYCTFLIPMYDHLTAPPLSGPGLTDLFGLHLAAGGLLCSAGAAGRHPRLPAAAPHLQPPHEGKNWGQGLQWVGVGSCQGPLCWACPVGNVPCHVMMFQF